MKKCIYCGKIVEEDLIDFCKSCGVRVWGNKMFNAIIANMKKAKERGDIE